MKIAIAERLHPFSHRPGTECLIPNSFWTAQVFPSLIRFKSLFSEQSLELQLKIKGPIPDFTVELDLEKGQVNVFGKTQEGYLNYQIVSEREGFKVTFNKLPQKQLSCRLAPSNAEHTIKEKEPLLIPVKQESSPLALPEERLSLGMHKAQDWDLVSRRKDLREIFPTWMRLGQMIPLKEADSLDFGTLRLLKSCEEVVEKSDRMQVCSEFLKLFQTAFQGILAPRLIDEEHQGILPIEGNVPADLFSSILLSKGARLIRALFLSEEENTWNLLPCLSPEFDTGRFVNLKSELNDNISLEWSKHQLKKMIVLPSQERKIVLKFAKPIRSFRVRRALKDRGQTVELSPEGQAQMHLAAGQILYFDRFEK